MSVRITRRVEPYVSGTLSVRYVESRIRGKVLHQARIIGKRWLSEHGVVLQNVHIEYGNPCARRHWTDHHLQGSPKNPKLQRDEERRKTGCR